MKIAVIGTRGFPGVQGGIENHCEHLYTQLAMSGCNITVFTRKPYVDHNPSVFKGVSLIPLSCPRNKFLEAIIHTFKGVLKARKLHPDILHIHGIGPSLFTPLARLLGMKVVVTSQGSDYQRKKWSLPAKIFLMFCEWAGMTFANEVIAVTNNISEDIKRKFGRNAYVIPNGVEIPNPSNTNDILRRFDLQEKRYILTVGRFVPEKGFDYLIDAFNSRDFEGWKLVIVGSADHDDKYSVALKNKAKKYSNIVLTGFLMGKPLKEIYTHAGLFVLPSYHEGLPIVLLEAMSYGLSCIVSDIPANRSVDLSDDRFFTPGNIKELAQKMWEFIFKLRDAEEIKKQIDMIDEKYNWGKIAERTLEVYQTVI